MRNTKVRLEFYTFFDRDGICRHLEKMAAKGWLPKKIGETVWIYRRIPPKALKFSLFYYPPAPETDAAAFQKQEAFHHLCRHDGWEFACANSQIQIFYNAQPNPVPLETEPALEVGRIYSAFLWRFLPPLLLLLTISALKVCRDIKWYNHLIAMGIPQNLRTTAWNTLILILVVSSCLAGIGQFSYWYHRAKKAAKKGVFLNPPKVLWVPLVLYLLGLALILLFP